MLYNSIQMGTPLNLRGFKLLQNRQLYFNRFAQKTMYVHTVKEGDHCFEEVGSLEVDTLWSRALSLVLTLLGS